MIEDPASDHGANGGDLVTFAARQVAEADGLRSRTVETDASYAAATPVALRPVAKAAPAEATPIAFSGGVDPNYRDPHLELADLLLAHETY